jgi:nucleoside-diphosphate-sugar epimerase
LRVLLLGSTPFLGLFVGDELLRRGHQVAALEQEPADFGGPVTRLDGPATDPEALAGAVKSWRPEGLVDFAHHHPDHVRSLMEACKGMLSRSVHLSTAAVYGPAPICPADEDTDLAARPPEDIAAQIEADTLALEAAERGELPATVVRLPELYGPRDPRCAEWYFARRVLDGRTRIAVPDGGLHICHRGFVQSMAWGIAQALLSPRATGQVYNLGEEKLYTLTQLVQGVARALDYEWEVYSVPGHLWATPHARTSFFDLRKARAQLRYQDRMIPRDGLELTLAWLCQNPRDDTWRWPEIENPFDYEREDELIARHGVRLGD